MHREAKWGTRLGLLPIMVYVMPDIRLFVDISHTSIQPLPVVNSSGKVATLVVVAAHPYLSPSLVLIDIKQVSSTPILVPFIALAYMINYNRVSGLFNG